MQVFGIVGRKNSGKTHLVTRLVRLASQRGLRVSTIKHAHHSFDIDHPGKDSHLHREAGAHEVLVASAERWAKARTSEMNRSGCSQAPKWPPREGSPPWTIEENRGSAHRR